MFKGIVFWAENVFLTWYAILNQKPLMRFYIDWPQSQPIHVYLFNAGLFRWSST